MAPRTDGPRFPDCTGALIAGGLGSRMGGVAKGLLRLDGEPLVVRALRVFQGLFAESVLVASDAAPYAALPVRATPDLLPGRGAPGGLHAALSAARTAWVFTAACDMPFLDAAQIAWLGEQRQGAPAVAVVWRGRLQPLHAFWSRACLPEIDRLLRQSQPSMWQLATAVGARLVPEEAWREVDPEGRAFENVNTPEDAARLGLEGP